MTYAVRFGKPVLLSVVVGSVYIPPLVAMKILLARLPLVLGPLSRGELVESFGAARRLPIQASYCLRVAPGAARRPEVARFVEWLRAEAQATRAALAGGP